MPLIRNRERSCQKANDGHLVRCEMVHGGAEVIRPRRGRLPHIIVHKSIHWWRLKIGRSAKAKKLNIHVCKVFTRIGVRYRHHAGFECRITPGRHLLDRASSRRIRVCFQAAKPFETCAFWVKLAEQTIE